MEYKQSRICDCWLEAGSCFCELNIKSNEGKDINTVAKKVQSLEGIVRALLGQMQGVKDISIGTLETLKRMDGYEEALNKLKEDNNLNSGNSKLVKDA